MTSIPGNSEKGSRPSTDLELWDPGTLPLTRPERLKKLEEIMARSNDAAFSDSLSFGLALLTVEEEGLFELQKIDGHVATVKEYRELARKFGAGCSASAASRARKWARGIKVLQENGVKFPWKLSRTLIMRFADLKPKLVLEAFANMMAETDGRPSDEAAEISIAKVTKGVPKDTRSSYQKLKDLVSRELQKAIAAIRENDGKAAMECLRAILNRVSKQKTEKTGTDSTPTPALTGRGSGALVPSHIAKPIAVTENDKPAKIPASPQDPIDGEAKALDPSIAVTAKVPPPNNPPMVKGCGWVMDYDNGSIFVRFDAMDERRELLKARSYGYDGKYWSARVPLAEAPKEMATIAELFKCTSVSP
ncbi:MAG TPA: hypothetical protein VNV15_08590 [Opitutaceae bacterium]|jgi:hypothetical protein|nr:hypothetical protein [Opitutaceae bacterium]